MIFYLYLEIIKALFSGGILAKRTVLSDITGGGSRVKKVLSIAIGWFCVRYVSFYVSSISLLVDPVLVLVSKIPLNFRSVSGSKGF